jgi:hypothetical protein
MPNITPNLSVDNFVANMLANDDSNKYTVLFLKARISELEPLQAKNDALIKQISELEKNNAAFQKRIFQLEEENASIVAANSVVDASTANKDSNEKQKTEPWQQTQGKKTATCSNSNDFPPLPISPRRSHPEWGADDDDTDDIDDTSMANTFAKMRH